MFADTVTGQLTPEVPVLDALAGGLKDAHRQRVALALKGLCLFEYDFVHRRSYLSPECLALWGLSEQPTVDRLMLQVDPDDLPRLKQTFRAQREGASEFVVVFRIIGGAARWVEVRGHTTFTGEAANRHPDRCVGIMLDVTERIADLAAARDRANRLHSLMSDLAVATSLPDVATAAVEKGGRAVGASTGALMLLDESGQTFTLVAGPGINARVKAQWNRFANSPTLPVGQAVRSRRPCYCRSRAEYIAHDPRLQQSADDLSVESAASLPLLVADRVIGTVSFVFRESKEFGSDEDVFLRTIADQVAQALARVQALNALTASEMRLRIALDAVGAGVFEWDIDSGHVAWSDGHWRILGLEPSSAHPSYDLWRRHVHPDDLARVESALQRAVSTGAMYTADYRIVRADGEERWVQGQGLVVEGPDVGRKMFGVTLDISHRKRNEQALLEVDRQKDIFLATLAHELRNPLAPIRLAAEVLGQPEATEPKRARSRTIIERQVRHMARLLDDLLDIARITQGKLTLHREKFSVASAVQAGIEATRPMIDSKRQALLVNVPPASLQIDADPVRISQIVSNLLANASKFTPAGGRIEIECVPDGPWVRIAVQDSGIGIATDALPHVFGMFNQLSAANAGGGLGIGLALVKGIVELHGGHIKAHSEGLNQGARFTVCLPAIEAAEGHPAAGHNEAEHVEAPRSRILVVDDNRDAADMLGTVLQAYGHDVEVAYDGSSALSVADAFRPDVVLLDIGMPDISGHDVARALRQRQWANGVLLIAVTGWGRAEDRRKTEASGFDTHLVKPIDSRSVLSLIHARATSGDKCPMPPEGDQ